MVVGTNDKTKCQICHNADAAPYNWNRCSISQVKSKKRNQWKWDDFRFEINVIFGLNKWACIFQFLRHNSYCFYSLYMKWFVKPQQRCPICIDFAKLYTKFIWKSFWYHLPAAMNGAQISPGHLPKQFRRHPVRSQWSRMYSIYLGNIGLAQEQLSSKPLQPHTHIWKTVAHSRA